MIALPRRAAAATFLAAVLALLAGARVNAEIYDVYNDKTTVGKDVFTWGSATFDGTYKGVSPAEGEKSFFTQGNGGWGIFYDAAAPENLSRFTTSGELRFWIRSNTGNIDVQLELANGQKLGWYLQPFWNVQTMTNVWTLFRIPVTGLNLSSVRSPFMITPRENATFMVDNVHYVTFNTSPYFNVVLRNISDNSVAPVITFNSVSLPAGWRVADQYIETELDSNSTAWGLQIYTDNTAADANPVFASAVAAGEPGSNPAGLVDTVVKSRTLPMAWSVKGSTITAPSPAEPNNSADKESFQWLYMSDRRTPAIALQNTSAFTDADPGVMVKSNAGIHYGQAPTEFGGSDSMNRIYLQANFASAVTPRTYRTTKLYLEYFYQ